MGFVKLGVWWAERDKYSVIFILMFSNVQNWEKNCIFWPMRNLFAFSNIGEKIRKFVKTCREQNIKDLGWVWEIWQSQPSAISAGKDEKLKKQVKGKLYDTLLYIIL